MSALTDLASDERHARMLMSLLAEPDDPVAGRLLRQAGAVETLRLLDGAGAVPGLSRVDSQIWRDHLPLHARLGDAAERLRDIERNGITTLIPGDAHWPGALDDLGDRSPYVLWTRGATSFLARPLSDFVDDHRRSGLHGLRRARRRRTRGQPRHQGARDGGWGRVRD